MGSTENTITSTSNTVLSSGGGGVPTTNAFPRVSIEESQSYVTYNDDVTNNYDIQSIPFDTNGDVIHPTSYNEDKIKSVTMCDDNSMATSDMILDDGSNDDIVNESTPNRRVRFKYTKSQLRRFEDYFRMNMFPDSITREEISKELNIPVRNVQVWFKNRRAKHRKSAQLDSSNSSYLENSTLLPTPDRPNIHPANYNTGYCGDVPISPFTSHSNPHHSMIMVNQFHPSSSTNNGYVMNSINNTIPNSAIGISAINNPNNVAAHNNHNRMLSYQNYGATHIIPNTYYRNDNKYIGSDMATSLFNSSSSQSRPNPLTNNPFVINVPPPNYQQQQSHYHHMLHHQYNSTQRPLFYHHVTQPSSTSHNENIPLPTNIEHHEHRKSEPMENIHNITTINQKSSGPEFQHENYINR